MHRQCSIAQWSILYAYAWFCDALSDAHKAPVGSNWAAKFGGNALFPLL